MLGHLTVYAHRYWVIGLILLVKYANLSASLAHVHGNGRTGLRRLLVKFCNQVK